MSSKKARPLSAAGALTPKASKGMSRRTPSAFAMRYDKENKAIGKEQRIDELGQAIELNQDRLMRIFSYYCSFGEPLNTNKMRSSKFIKLLKDAKLLPQDISDSQSGKKSIMSGTPKSLSNNVYGIRKPPMGMGSPAAKGSSKKLQTL